MDLFLDELIREGPELSTFAWTSRWPRLATLAHLHVTAHRHIAQHIAARLYRLYFPYLVLTKGPIELSKITKIVLRSGVYFDSMDLASMAKACPALADLTLGDTDENFTLNGDQPNSMSLLRHDNGVLMQLHVSINVSVQCLGSMSRFNVPVQCLSSMSHAKLAQSMKALTRLAVAIDIANVAICADLVNMPSWITKVSLGIDLPDVDPVMPSLLGIDLDTLHMQLVTSIGRHRMASLCMMTNEYRHPVDGNIDVFEGLTGLTKVIWDPSDNNEYDGLPILSMHCLRSLTLCGLLSELFLGFEVDADVAAALLALPLLKSLGVQGPMPLPPDFCIIRKAPLDYIRFGEKLLPDWTPMLRLVDPSGPMICRRIELFNKWTSRTDTVTLNLSSEDGVARCRSLLTILHVKNINDEQHDPPVPGDDLTKLWDIDIVYSFDDVYIETRLKEYFINTWIDE